MLQRTPLPDVDILAGDAIDVLSLIPAGHFQCCVTSPPYFRLRDYGVAGQIGLEPTLAEYVEKIVGVCRAIRRVLREDGTLWLNLGDAYATSPRGNKPGDFSTSFLTNPKRQDRVGRGRNTISASGLKPKNLMMIPARVALALQDDGWWIRSEIVWRKPNPMPESVRDRPTSSHEKVFLLTKSGSTKLWRARDTLEWSYVPDLSDRVPAPTEKNPFATARRWVGYDYFYDAEAIRNAPSDAMLRQVADGYAGSDTKDFGAAGAQQASVTKSRIIARAREKQRGHGRRHAGFNDRWDSLTKEEQQALGSNARNAWMDVADEDEDLWSISPRPFRGAHFATFPERLVERCLLAGSRPGDRVLDPFGGSGTTAVVARRLGRLVTLVEINPDYREIARERLRTSA